MSERIRVLVVDDSALMRKLIPAILARDSSIEVVGTAMDGAFALKKIEELKPDVVTLDLEMPRMDGMETLRLIMGRAPMPVILFSTHSKEGGYATFKALALGAVDFVTKPKEAASKKSPTSSSQKSKWPSVRPAGSSLLPSSPTICPFEKRETERRCRRDALLPSEFPPAARTRCNLFCRKFPRIFNPPSCWCSTCPKDSRKCLRSASMSAAPSKF